MAETTLLHGLGTCKARASSLTPPRDLRGAHSTGLQPGGVEKWAALPSASGAVVLSNIKRQKEAPGPFSELSIHLYLYPDRCLGNFISKTEGKLKKSHLTSFIKCGSLGTAATETHSCSQLSRMTDFHSKEREQMLFQSRDRKESDSERDRDRETDQ